MDPILVVNAGSSSVKFQLFAAANASPTKRLLRGQIEGIGTRPRLEARDCDSLTLVSSDLSPAEVPDVASGLRAAASWLRDKQKVTPAAIGHRVVHGGPDYDQPVLVNEKVLANLERYCPLAPLHQPNNLAPIRAMLARAPDLPQVACFDTAFHRSHDSVADHYALPDSLYADGVRHYGFHGLSYEYISRRLRRIAPEIADKRVVIAHLGSGASMCALRGGKSVDSSMGFTALDGLPMGTRPGQMDPGIVLYLIMQKGMSAAAVQDLLYRDCGLKGLSGISNDMRELIASSDPRAAFTVDYFVRHVAMWTGMLAASLGGIDGLVFTAGIGERSPPIRQRVCDKLGWLGITLDLATNAAAGPRISAADSRVAVYVVPTDEELMIAEHTMALLSEKEATA